MSEATRRASRTRRPTPTPASWPSWSDRCASLKMPSLSSLLGPTVLLGDLQLRGGGEFSPVHTKGESPRGMAPIPDHRASPPAATCRRDPWRPPPSLPHAVGTVCSAASPLA